MSILYAAPTSTTWNNIWAVTSEESYASSAAKFVAEYKASGLYSSSNKISDDSATQLYWLLTARYGNNVPNSTDWFRFKLQVFSLIYEYGPSWERQLSLQKSLRDLTDSDLTDGGFAVFNHAFNPGTAPSTDVLTAINDQNTTKQTRSKVAGYAMLQSLLEADVTGAFLDRYKPLFRTVIAPVNQIVFDAEDDD